MIVTNTANRTSNDKLSKLLDVLNKRFRLNIQSDPDGPAIKIVLKWDSGIVRNRKMSKELTEFESDPYSLFIFAINSPLTKQKYIPRLNKFFDFINLSGTIQERCKAFVKKSKDEPSCVVAYVIKYLQMIKERVEKREITAATAPVPIDDFREFLRVLHAMSTPAIHFPSKEIQLNK